METSATTIVVPPTAEEQRIASIADSINLADPSLTVTYGTEAMQGISRFADDLLSRVQAKDSGELGESLTNLMLKVKDVNVSEVMGSPGFLQSLPLVGSLFSSAKRTVAKFNTLSEQIEIIVDKLDEAMIGLLRDIETLEMLYEHNARFHAELTAYIEAGKRKLEEARTVELPRLKAQADASGDLMEAQQVRDLSEQINRFERRLHDLQLSRTITVQTAPQIRIIQSNNRTLAEKIQTSILATIPIWKSQMVLALSLHGQKNAAALQKTVSDTTNDMLRSNAELLEQAAVDTAREVERSVVDIETLREVHEKLIGTIEETLRIAQEGRERRAAAEKELDDDSEIEIRNWETSIGRSRSCDISLRKYGTVSRFHAVLALRKDGWYVFDTESKTGVYVNGEQIKKSAKIIDGDTVSFGNAVMKFTSNGYGVESEEAEDGKKVDFTNATRLVNLADNSAFYLNGTCLIGRDRTCNICLPMQSVSGEHAEVYPAKDGWYVADLNSKNGTLLNGEEVFGAFPLYDGDIISIGDYSFLFRE